MFAVTVALLLVRNVAYRELAGTELHFRDADIPIVADCIESRLPPLVRDVGVGTELRKRLGDFVGMRVASFIHPASDDGVHPTTRKATRTTRDRKDKAELN